MTEMYLPKEYLNYPHRRRGMDHNWYQYSNLFAREPITWPNKARIAFCVMPILQYFPLNMEPLGFRPVGAMERAYPDYFNFTQRDYGNRVGVARVFDAIERRGLRASVAMNSRLTERYPELIRDIKERQWEIVAHGRDMNSLHVGGLNKKEEISLVRHSIETLKRLSNCPIRGWFSPAYSETFDTLDILSKAGIDYVCDWVNDDMPFRIQTSNGCVFAMPHAFEVMDQQILLTQGQTSEDYIEQVIDYFKCLYEEAKNYGGRMLVLPLHPWISGVPRHINAVEEVLDTVMAHDGVWTATMEQMLEVVRTKI